MAGKKPTDRVLHIELLAIDLIKVDPNNVRTHSEKQVAILAKGMTEFGMINPVLIDDDNQLIAGHARKLAAIKRGYKALPCIRISGLTAHQRTMLAISDNKIHDMSSFDLVGLTEQLRELDSVDIDIELTGFNTGEIDVLLGEDASTVEKSDPADAGVSTQKGPSISKPGDLWLLGPHRLLCGNALEEASFKTLLGDEKADLAICDMPFNVPIAGHVSGLGKNKHAEFAMASGEMTSEEFIQFLIKAFLLLVQFSKNGSIHYQFMDHRHMLEILAAGKVAYTDLKNLCVWDKVTAGMGSTYRSQHELVFVFKNGSAPHKNNVELGRNGRHRTNVWRYPGLSGFGKGREASLARHPTCKPVALIADAIRDCSKRGDLVLDSFAGSGTVIIAAERAKRRAAAIEIDAHYVDGAVRRWQKFTGVEGRLFGDGRSFDEVAAERLNLSSSEEAGE